MTHRNREGRQARLEAAVVTDHKEVTTADRGGTRAATAWGEPCLVAAKATVTCPPRGHQARLEAGASVHEGGNS